MRRTEVIDAADQVHAAFHNLFMSKKTAATPHQTTEALTESGVYALDVRRVHLLAHDVESFEEFLGSLDQAVIHANHALLLVTLDHLADYHIGPEDVAGAASPA